LSGNGTPGEIAVMAKKKKEEKTLHVTWVKSAIGYSKRQKATIRALGLRRLNQTVEQRDTPSVRGMIERVRHLVKVEETGN
jgi:large subunit ribosomal protein L30